MWPPYLNAERRRGRNGLVAIAIDKDKGSQLAMKWTAENLLSKGQSLILIHVVQKPAATTTNKQINEKNTKEIFLPFHCFCTRKNIRWFDVVLEDIDIARAISEYVAYAGIENLVLGASRHGFIRRQQEANVPYSVSRAAPDFCSVYVILKTKISSLRNAWRLAPFTSPLITQMQEKANNNETFSTDARPKHTPSSFTDSSSSSLENDDVEAEMRMLKLELQKTMEMYSKACKEALTSNQKAVELHRWRMDEERRLQEPRLAKEAARMNAEQKKAKYQSAMENAQAAQRIAERESQQRVNAERQTIQDEKEKEMIVTPLRSKRYSIEEIEEATEYFSESRKIGEGGYGPVYKCFLNHTPVAIKVLRPDAAQGRSQFQQEVEVLSCMRHPNVVLLLGACPEYGYLVYEHMANGSLEDRLFKKGNTRALSWQLRFRIAAEIALGLNFLHQTKPEPLVHRNLKLGNILLDQNYVSKIGDVRLARLVPPSVAEDVTQYRMTSTVGTFCYIDPEYQQTRMLNVKSDIYSLGIVLLQIITAKPAMGLIQRIEQAIKRGTFAKILDPSVTDWPVEEALSFAKLALQCTELRRKDRPELSKVVVPELMKLKELGEENMGPLLVAPPRQP